MRWTGRCPVSQTSGLPFFASLCYTYSGGVAAPPRLAERTSELKMIRCIHVDRTNALSEHQKITLRQAPPSSMCKSIVKFALELFPDGLSSFGWRYIAGIYRISNGDLTQHDDFIDCLIEHDFELVRRQHYPDAPSRLQSLFAVASIGDILKTWSGIMTNDCVFFEILSDEVYVRDASYLKAYSLCTECELTDKTPGYENICKYWECEQSHEPVIELLLPLSSNVRVGTRLSIL